MTITLQGDLYALAVSDKYIDAPSGGLWTKSHVDKRFPKVNVGTDQNGAPILMSPTTWLARNRAVEQMSWLPGQPQIVRDMMVDDGGLIPRQGRSIYNRFRPAPEIPGDAEQAERWRDHVMMLYPNDGAHIINCLAYKVQNPDKKINHGVVLGGVPGIGKDTILEPAITALGSWNCSDVQPSMLNSEFNPFLQAVLMRINEARDSGDVNRFQLYQHTKIWMAAPPMQLTINQKGIPTYKIPNIVFPIITTNFRQGGLYLEADDRRHYVAYSEITKEDFGTGEEHEAYFIDLFRWLREDGGNGHVAALLRTLDLGGFNPYGTPEKTPAFWAMVAYDTSPEEGPLADLLESLGSPVALTKENLISRAEGNFLSFLQDPKNGRSVNRKLEKAGYITVENPESGQGLWRVGGSRKAIYAPKTLTASERLAAAAALAEVGGNLNQLSNWAIAQGLQRG
jgi:hypothetical protein